MLPHSLIDTLYFQLYHIVERYLCSPTRMLPRSLWNSVLRLLLLLTPALARSPDDDRPISPCIWDCLANYASNVETFTCVTIIDNTPLVDCIRECPVHDIDNFNHQVLGLPADCEAQLYPGATGSITDLPTSTESSKPTGSSNGEGGNHDCNLMSGDNQNSTSWSGSCTKTEDVTGTMTTHVAPTASDGAFVESTGTGTTRNSSTTIARPTSTHVAAAATFGYPSVGVLVMGMVAWAFAL